VFSGAVTFNGKMWIITGGSPCVAAGWFKPDVWYSSDGSTWNQATSNAPFGYRVSPGCVAFNNKMWIFMGSDYASGLYDDAWYSSDGVNWTKEASPLPMMPRSSFGCVVFNNKIWIIGGDVGAGNTTLLDDVWNSPDGINWTYIGTMPTYRSEFGCVAYNGALWVIGGNLGWPYAANDVWTSPDGVNWTQTTSGAPFAARDRLSVGAFNGSLWVVDGADNNGVNNVTSTYPDIWTSQDGTNWSQATASAPFGPRFGAESLVFNNQLWMIEGAWYSTGQTWNGTYETGVVYWNDIWHTQ